MKQFRNFCVIMVGAMIPTLTLGLLQNELVEISWWKLSGVLIITAICIFLLLNRKNKTRKVRQYVFGILGGGLYGIFYIYGLYIHTNTRSAREFLPVLKILLKGIGFSVFPICIFLVILTYLPTWRERLAHCIEPLCSEKEHKASHVVLLYTGLVFLFFIPVFLAYYPVIIQYDGAYQLQDVIRNTHSTWHPLAHTLLMGLFYNWGASIGSVTVGMAVYTLLQSLLLAFAFGYTGASLYKAHAPRWFRWVLILIYALFPINAIFAITTTKDVIFAALFLLFQVQFVNTILDQHAISWKKVIWMALTGGVMLLYRNNAIYALLLASPFMILFYKGNRIRTSVILFGSVLLYLFANKALIAAAHTTSSTRATEMLSVPLMQMAYVVTEDGNTMKQDMKDEILSYIPESSLQGYYTVIADQIKGAADNDKICENKMNFMKLWMKTGLQHPIEYVDAFALLTMGYWYPDDIYHSMIYGKFMLLETKQIGMGEEPVQHNYCPLEKNILTHLFGDNQYQKIPLLSTLCKPALYFWLLVGYTLIAWYEKKGKLFLPSIFCWTYYATLFLGPVALVRYMYCIMIFIPLLIFMLLFYREKEQNLS